MKSQKNRIELVTRPCASDTPPESPSFPLTPLRRCVRVLFVATLTRLHYVFRHCFRSPHNSRCGTALVTGLLPVILVLGESSALPETQRVDPSGVDETLSDSWGCDFGRLCEVEQSVGSALCGCLRQLIGPGHDHVHLRHMPGTVVGNLEKSL